MPKNLLKSPVIVSTFLVATVVVALANPVAAAGVAIAFALGGVGLANSENSQTTLHDSWEASKPSNDDLQASTYSKAPKYLFIIHDHDLPARAMPIQRKLFALKRTFESLNHKVSNLSNENKEYKITIVTTDHGLNATFSLKDNGYDGEKDFRTSLNELYFSIGSSFQTGNPATVIMRGLGAIEGVDVIREVDASRGVVTKWGYGNLNDVPVIKVPTPFFNDLVKHNSNKLNFTDYDAVCFFNPAARHSMGLSRKDLGVNYGGDSENDSCFQPILPDSAGHDTTEFKHASIGASSMFELDL